MQLWFAGCAVLCGVFATVAASNGAPEIAALAIVPASFFAYFVWLLRPRKHRGDWS